MSIINPKILQGTRDFLPAEMVRRDFVMDKIKLVFSRFGYDPIDTPAIEYAETLLGKYGDEGSKLIYRFKDNGDRDIALRYDQTVPFARLVSQYYGQLTMPFKRYQIGKVWRADKPAKGRYREFTQCDIDIVGTNNLLAEGEIAAVIYGVFTSLNFKKVTIKFNSRLLVNSVMDKLNIPTETQPMVMRSLDKFMKIGVDGVRNELCTTLSATTVDILLDLINFQGTNEEKLARLKLYVTDDIREFLKVAQEFGIPEEYLDFDISLVRGLDYYTGLVFEVYVSNALEIGAVCSGGRYDNLCSLFSNKDMSGVGVSFGFDRVVLAMEEAGLLKNISQNTQALVTYFNESLRRNTIAIADELRKVNIKAETYFEPQRLDKQIKYADKKKIPFVIICGDDEVRDNTVTIKNMASGKQKTIPRLQLASYFNGYTVL